MQAICSPVQSASASRIIRMYLWLLVTKGAETGGMDRARRRSSGTSGRNLVIEMTPHSGAKHADSAPMDAAAVKA